MTAKSSAKTRSKRKARSGPVKARAKPRGPKKPKKLASDTATAPRKKRAKQTTKQTTKTQRDRRPRKSQQAEQPTAVAVRPVVPVVQPAALAAVTTADDREDRRPVVVATQPRPAARTLEVVQPKAKWRGPNWDLLKFTLATGAVGGSALIIWWILFCSGGSGVGLGRGRGRGRGTAPGARPGLPPPPLPTPPAPVVPEPQTQEEGNAYALTFERNPQRPGYLRWWHTNLWIPGRAAPVVIDGGIVGTAEQKHDRWWRNLADAVGKAVTRPDDVLYIENIRDEGDDYYLFNELGVAEWTRALYDAIRARVPDFPKDNIRWSSTREIEALLGRRLR